MTNDEFCIQQEEIVRNLPTSFASFARTWAWEHGHSSGYEEVLGILSEIVFDLEKAVEKYNEAIR